MSTLSRPNGTGRPRSGVAIERALLVCGVVYGAFYALTNDVVASAMLTSYNAIDQAVSELSATGATSRPFLVAMAPIYALLLIAFGVGVRIAACGVRRLRITGDLLIAFGVLGVLWLPFPMSPRDELVAASARGNDIGHIVLTAASVTLICACIIVGSVTFGRRFRIYSWITIIVTLLFGALTGVLSGNLDKGQPTPWMGLLERVSMGAWFAWLAVLALLLLRQSFANPGLPAVMDASRAQELAR